MALGISCGIAVFVIIFGVIYVYTECKKPKSVFREEATAEDRLLKREFPKTNTQQPNDIKDL